MTEINNFIFVEWVVVRVRVRGMVGCRFEDLCRPGIVSEIGIQYQSHPVYRYIIYAESGRDIEDSSPPHSPYPVFSQ